MNLEYLSWDSDFFSKKIGKISCNSNAESELRLLLSKAKEQGYQLVYVFGEENLFLDQLFLKKYYAKLVDRKVIYTQSLVATEKTINKVEEYKNLIITDELESLSYLSGACSRFRLDNHFEPEEFFRLYKTWMSKSLSGELADKVFVVRELNEIVGIVTLKFQKEVGNIGLIAVSETVQNKGYGKDLINACRNAVISEGFQQLEVPTQMGNISACRFYEKCGFKIKSITNIYHFWL